jgi:uncharacterized protein (TIGR03435 family)
MRRTTWLLLVCLNTFGQASFEVASIKPHPEPITYSADARSNGTLVTATASTLLDLITSAYGVRYDQVSGGPGWMKIDHFDLAARAAGETPITTNQMRQMLQSLLADRFQLKLHREMKEVPMWDLVVAKNGPKSKAFDPEGRSGGISVANGAAHMAVSKGTMEQLAQRLAGNGAGRPVRDKTGLAGYYSYTLDFEWTNGTPAIDPDARTLFDALQEQLGLRLESTRGSAEAIVIDHAERPSAN